MSRQRVIDAISSTLEALSTNSVVQGSSTPRAFQRSSDSHNSTDNVISQQDLEKLADILTTITQRVSQPDLVELKSNNSGNNRSHLPNKAPLTIQGVKFNDSLGGTQVLDLASSKSGAINYGSVDVILCNHAGESEKISVSSRITVFEMKEAILIHNNVPVEYEEEYEISLINRENVQVLANVNKTLGKLAKSVSTGIPQLQIRPSPSHSWKLSVQVEETVRSVRVNSYFTVRTLMETLLGMENLSLRHSFDWQLKAGYATPGSQFNVLDSTSEELLDPIDTQLRWLFAPKDIEVVRKPAKTVTLHKMREKLVPTLHSTYHGRSSVPMKGSDKQPRPNSATKIPPSRRGSFQLVSFMSRRGSADGHHSRSGEQLNAVKRVSSIPANAPPVETEGPRKWGNFFSTSPEQGSGKDSNEKGSKSWGEKIFGILKSRRGSVKDNKLSAGNSMGSHPLDEDLSDDDDIGHERTSTSSGARTRRSSIATSKVYNSHSRESKSPRRNSVAPTHGAMLHKPNGNGSARDINSSRDSMPGNLSKEDRRDSLNRATNRSKPTLDDAAQRSLKRRTSEDKTSLTPTKHSTTILEEANQNIKAESRRSVKRPPTPDYSGMPFRKPSMKEEAISEQDEGQVSELTHLFSTNMPSGTTSLGALIKNSASAEFMSNYSLLRDGSPFKIVKSIAMGQFGKVLLCKIKYSDDLCAIKVVDKSSGRLAIEKEIVDNLRHPNIIACHGYYESDHRGYFVMDYASAGELYWRVAKGPLLGEERVRSIMTEIVSALDYMHGQGYLYRDMKLENLLMTEDEHVKLSDFGLSVRVTDNAGRSELLGTPEYYAPEIIQGYPASFATDWWAVGLVMHEMLLRRHPFYDEDKETMFSKILNQGLNLPPPPPNNEPESLQPHPLKLTLSEEASSLIHALLAKSPNQRLSSGDEVMSHPFFKKKM